MPSPIVRASPHGDVTPTAAEGGDIVGGVREGEPEPLRTVSREQTRAEDSRADDDGMAASDSPAVVEPDSPGGRR